MDQVAVELAGLVDAQDRFADGLTVPEEGDRRVEPQGTRIRPELGVEPLEPHGGGETAARSVEEGLVATQEREDDLRAERSADGGPQYHEHQRQVAREPGVAGPAATHAVDGPPSASLLASHA